MERLTYEEFCKALMPRISCDCICPARMFGDECCSFMTCDSCLNKPVPDEVIQDVVDHFRLFLFDRLGKEVYDEFRKTCEELVNPELYYECGDGVKHRYYGFYRECETIDEVKARINKKLKEKEKRNE